MALSEKFKANTAVGALAPVALGSVVTLLSKAPEEKLGNLFDNPVVRNATTAALNSGLFAAAMAPSTALCAATAAAASFVCRDENRKTLRSTSKTLGAVSLGNFVAAAGGLALSLAAMSSIDTNVKSVPYVPDPRYPVHMTSVTPQDGNIVAPAALTGPTNG